MSETLDHVSCARLPAGALARLGAFRARLDLHAVVAGELLWVYWSVGDAELARCLLALPGAVLFERAGAVWRRLGERLPAFDVPDPSAARSLPALLAPAPFEPQSPPPRLPRAATLRLVRSEAFHPASALLLDRTDLVHWGESATSHHLAGLTAACCAERVLLRGRLPALRGERFWGERVLLPSGWRLEPALDESVLAAALRLKPGDVALVSVAGAEIVPEEAFGSLTRAGLRCVREGRADAR